MSRQRSFSTKRQREQARKNRQENKEKRRAERKAARESTSLGQPVEGAPPTSDEIPQEGAVGDQGVVVSQDTQLEPPHEGGEPAGDPGGGEIAPHLPDEKPAGE